MSLPLTPNTISAISQVSKEPNIVLEIDGVETIYGAITIRRYAIIGDDLVIGEPGIDPGAFYIGGLAELIGQDNAISLNETTSSIRQSLTIDKGQAGSISNMSVALIDNGDITKLVTPGNMLPDILGAKCKVFLGFSNVAWPDDYVTIFRGVITEVSSDAGKIILQINSPEDKKKGSLFPRVNVKLPASINASVTSITLSNVTGLFQKITGPSGAVDTGFETYVRIDDEIIKFSTIAGNTLNGCVRGQLNTVAASHAADAEVSSYYVITGNCVDIALKLLASGFNGYFRSGLAVASFGQVESVITPNAVYFDTIDLAAKYNIQVGDYVTTTGATNGANNFTLRAIEEIVSVDSGSYLVVGGAPLVIESDSPAVMSVRSQYDVWPDGVTLDNDEIDFDEHLRLKRLFLSNFDYTIYLKDTIDNATDFIETEIYSPVAAYSLPRKTRASIGYHIGPIPGQDIKVIDENAVKSASKTKLTRTTARNFYNEIVYRFDESVLEDKFQTGVITISATSKNQIKTANKTLTISSKGLRSTEQGEAIAISQSNRRLNRYRFAAESLKLSVTFDVGFNLEVGDIVVYDGTNLALPDIKTGSKGIAPRLFEISNKDINIKTGDVSLELLDTNFAGSGRYCLMSPSSLIAGAASTSQFTIKPSYSARFGTAEYRKWEQLSGASVRVRNADFSVVGSTVLVGISFNTLTVSPALSFTPSADMVFELTDYDDVDVTDKVKLIYGHMSPLTGGDLDYQML